MVVLLLRMQGRPRWRLKKMKKKIRKRRNTEKSQSVTNFGMSMQIYPGCLCVMFKRCFLRGPIDDNGRTERIICMYSIKDRLSSSEKNDSRNDFDPAWKVVILQPTKFFFLSLSFSQKKKKKNPKYIWLAIDGTGVQLETELRHTER